MKQVLAFIDNNKKWLLPTAIISTLVLLAAVIILISVWPKEPRELPDIAADLKNLKEQYQILADERKQIQQTIDLTDKVLSLYKEKDAAIVEALKANGSLIDQIKTQYATLNRYDKFSSADIRKYFSDEFGK